MISSTRIIMADGGTARAFASLKIIRMLGWLTPRSMRLTKFRSIPASSASCSCERPAFFLSVRSTWPKMIAGSKIPPSILGGILALGHH